MDKKSIKIVLIIIVSCIALWSILRVLTYQKSYVQELNLTAHITSQKGRETLDNWLQTLEKDEKFNGGVALIKNGEPIFMNTYGYADHTSTKALTNDASFRLGSVSKQFTAFGIMLLKKANKINYDTPVSVYIRDFPYPGVTVRHLLTMTSGIPDNYLQLAEKYKNTIGNTLSIQQAVKLVCTNPGKVAPPGSMYQYSNTNYILLAAIIENVSKTSFETYMQKTVFDPFKMTNSRVWNLFSSTATFKNKTLGFQRNGNMRYPVLPTFIDGVSGDGGIFSSLTDFVIWDSLLYGNHLLSNEEMQVAFQPMILDNGDISTYGFGWSLGDNYVQHSGGWLAARTFIYRNTSNKTCLVILDNGYNEWHFPKIQENLMKVVDTL